MTASPESNPRAAKKRHHYIPKAYLKAFCDHTGKVHAYRKDDPRKVLHLSPDSTGFRKYYYSQPRPEGGKDHNALESLFSTIEEKWPGIVEKLHRRENVNDCLEDIFPFMGFMRARVPASRDATEKIHVEGVKAAARRLEKAGMLPPPPEGFENLLEHVEVSINPHQSIHAMVPVIQGAGEVFGRLGFMALHNKTNVQFLTSDNPVIWFDPSVHDSDLQPYVLMPDGPVTLLFPVSPSLIIYGHSAGLRQFTSQGLAAKDLTKAGIVKMINRQICRFGYEMIFAQKEGHEALIQKYAALSPVMSFDDSSGIFQMVFGKRERKPKWVD